jgi:hypothetical protein
MDAISTTVVTDDPARATADLAQRRREHEEAPPARRLPRHARPGDPAALRARWHVEIEAGRTARRAGDHAEEWRRLERAHILSQPLVGAHVRTHVDMLGFALRCRDRHEAGGQVVRLLLAGLGSASGRYPLGNTGGANVSAIRPMDIPDDLRPHLPAG